MGRTYSDEIMHNNGRALSGKNTLYNADLMFRKGRLQCRYAKNMRRLHIEAVDKTFCANAVSAVRALEPATP